MLQISNLDDNKSEWNINETHIIIPMINGTLTNKESDKILTNTFTLNSLENGDHSLVSNTLEHSFVIGLDKNFFDTSNYKSDLVIIQNSDLKLLPCNNDLKNSVAYTVSYVDQNKSEIFWQGSGLKDKTGLNDKAILEVRDVLNYDYTVHELEKTELQINVNTANSDVASKVAKTNNGIFIAESVDEAEIEKNSSYFVTVSNDESATVLQHLNASNSIGNIKLGNNENLFLYKTQSSSNCANDPGGNIQNITEEVIECDELTPVYSADIIKFKSDEKKKGFLNEDINNREEGVKESFIEASNSMPEKSFIEASDSMPEKSFIGASDFMLEKSLPLKKKAKMKRTVILSNSENQRSLFKQDVGSKLQVNMKSPGKKIQNLLNMVNVHDKQNKHTDSNEFVVNKIKKETNAKIKVISRNIKNLEPDFSIQKAKNELKNLSYQSVKEKGLKTIDGLDGNKFKNIYDLIEHLRKCRLINTTVLETLKSGLKEIKIDILKEMNSKKNKESSLESFKYSPQLKAFALVLYFKQPAAFNHLSKVFKAGWPSLKIIKEWKRRINSYQRPNFVNIKVNSEAVK